MEFVILYAASDHDYSEIYSHYKTREITLAEKMEGVWGSLVITFDSLEELMHFVGEVGDTIVGETVKKDGTFFKSIVIYDDYLE